MDEDAARQTSRAPAGDDELVSETPAGASLTQEASDEADRLEQLVAGVIADVQDMVRSEVELAKQEVRGDVKSATEGAAFVGTAGMFAVVGTAFLTQSLVLLLSKRMPRWAAAGVVGGGLTVAAAGLGMAGKAKLSPSHLKPEAAIQTLKTDVAWLKQQVQQFGGNGE